MFLQQGAIVFIIFILGRHLFQLSCLLTLLLRSNNSFNPIIPIISEGKEKVSCLYVLTKGIVVIIFIWVDTCFSWVACSPCFSSETIRQTSGIISERERRIGSLSIYSYNYKGVVVIIFILLNYICVLFVYHKRRGNWQWQEVRKYQI